MTKNRGLQALAALLLGVFLLGMSPLTTSEKLVNSGLVLSNGATLAVVVTASGVTRTDLAGGVIYNSDTVGHIVDVCSSGGSLIREFPLAGGATVGAYGVAVFDEVAGMQSGIGEGISIKLPNFGAEGGSATSVRATVSAAQK